MFTDVDLKFTAVDVEEEDLMIQLPWAISSVISTKLRYSDYWTNPAFCVHGFRKGSLPKLYLLES